MSEGQTTDHMQQMFASGQTGGGGGGGGGEAQLSPGVVALGKILGVEVSDREEVLGHIAPGAANANQGFELSTAGLHLYDSQGGFFAKIWAEIAKLCALQSSPHDNMTDGISAPGEGSGGDYGGGGGGDYEGSGSSGGGGSSSDYEPATGAAGGGGDDFRGMVHHGDFSGQAFHAEDVGHHSAPGATPVEAMPLASAGRGGGDD